MVDVQERVVRLEGRVEGHARMLTDVAGAVRHLEARMERFESRMDHRFTAVDTRLSALEQNIDRRCDAVDQRMSTFDQKIGRIETRLERTLDSHFRWIVGIQFAILIALIASLATITR